MGLNSNVESMSCSFLMKVRMTFNDLLEFFSKRSKIIRVKFIDAYVKLLKKLYSNDNIER